MTRYYASAEVKDRSATSRYRLLAFDNVDFGQTIYLSKFYEAIEAIDGVDFKNISEFRRQDATAGTVDPEGKIVLLAHQIPTIPTGMTRRMPVVFARLRGRLSMRSVRYGSAPPAGNRIDLTWAYPAFHAVSRQHGVVRAHIRPYRSPAPRRGHRGSGHQPDRTGPGPGGGW